MSDDVKLSGRRKFIKWFFIRLPFALLLAGGLMIGVLKLAERYTDPLRQGIEDFLSEQLQANATIEELEKMTFVPNLDIQLRSVSIHDRSNAALIQMKLDKAQVSIPLWSMFLGAGYLNQLYVSGLRAEAGVLMPRTLKDIVVTIEEGEDTKIGQLSVVGLYGGKEMVFKSALQKKGERYHIGNNISFSAKIGDEVVAGFLKKGFSTLHLIDVVYKKGNEKSLSKNYEVKKFGDKESENPLSCILGFDGDKNCNVYLTAESFQ